MAPELLARAACTGLYSDWFYPEDEEPEAYLRARAVCAACSVRFECLTYALARNERHGMWGGHTPSERRALRRRLARIERAARPEPAPAASPTAERPRVSPPPPTVILRRGPGS